ncbi:polysaccharide pyruvyl transferase family protein [Campylobacter sp. US33a]|uniref:polysaccharide pyruvyl transferase family protein n=1 Tax=Campylobacter sp. US33a TaxID=2498120 RepID=UPI001FBBBEE9|nr:polysaccharide pyruvyl transferase family protein [Campylobacter sp. US33a]
MQAYFAKKKSFIPNSSVLSVFIGTHFTGGTQNFLRQFLAINPEHFKDKEIGCRDDFTLDFCKNLGLKSYLLCCLTLTLPKRKTTNLQNKVFLVNVPDSYLQYLPKELLQNAERINQKGVRSALANEKEFYEQIKALLKRYENEAKLVIAIALHCASHGYGYTCCLAC